ncbi:MAG TPA: polyprenyl synthetase family protein [Planctomycetota bacterium]|nr:polyprenyl synthetase family protein [Planctomycetota bacterium]
MSPEQRERELRGLIAPIAEELDACSVDLTRELDSASEAVREVVAHANRYRGKRLRAANVLLVASACGRVTPAHVKIAAIVEMIHMATLVHDDVLDGAEVRRRVATPNARFGNEVAVLLGDWIYARAFSISTKLESQTCSRVLAETTATICRGEIEQSLAKYDFGLTVERYLEMIDAKTAALYAASCELGARYADAREECVRAARVFGRSLGLAFQIVDDCLDLDGSESEVGKSLGTDVVEGKITLPILHLLARGGPRERRRVEEIFRAEGSFDRVGALAAELDLIGAIEASYADAERYLRAALDALGPFPPSPARDCMAAMAEYVLCRRW